MPHLPPKHVPTSLLPEIGLTMSDKKPMNLVRLAALAALLVPASCGGGGSSSGSVLGNGFQLVDMSIPAGAIWQINRPIDFSFSLPVDFSTVSLNTIAIRDLSGMPASGAFTLLDSQTVRFQPTCPTLGDLSDSGLKIGGVNYQISVFGAVGGSGLSVKSAAGKTLKNSQYLTFTTPGSSTPAVAFIDIKSGPPTPVVRQYAVDGSVINPSSEVCFIETAGGAGAPIEFEFDAATQTFSQPLEQGLNFYSDAMSQLAVIVEFNQPVNPADANISSERLYLEYKDISGGPDNWVPIATEVALERNCSSTGAELRLEPQGILPQDSELRVVVTTEFEDLVGDRNQLQVDNFAHFRTTVVNFPGLVPVDDTGDEIKEDFLIPGGQFGSLEDLSAAFPEPRAIWANGKLSAAFNFSGTGGSDGAFDWVVPSGVQILLDTSGAISIQGGDIGVNMENLGSFVATKQQNVVGGQVNVRHLVIQAGASIKSVGVNAVKIQASGNVLIRGTLDVSGFDRPDVATLNTGNQPEVGAAGTAGGGAGGTASFLTTTSTPQGGNGFGPFNQANLGGQGGESGFGQGGKDVRRPGGGGGGRLGPNATGGTDLSGVSFGMIGEPGFDGGPQATGAITGLKPPKGGALGFPPFFDSDENNNFYGSSFDGTSVILGELSKPSAAGGGGAGGDAVTDSVFPHSSWGPGTDEKGCGGAGGAGSLHVLCLGNITLEGDGRIIAKGGNGGSGENTINNDHLGGGSGGGGGGHIVLEAGSQVVFDGVTANCIAAQGGKGGQGKPSSTLNKGGSGGPGLIQIHVLDPTLDIVFQNALPTANTLNEVTFPDAMTLVPSFGARSRARSRWIAVGGASVKPGGGTDPVTFIFQGTDITSGLALDLDDDDFVDLVPSILGPVSLVASPGLPSIGVDLRTLTVDATAIAGSFDDIYLRNPQLLRDAVLELREIGAPANLQRFNIASATFDVDTKALAMEVSGAPAPSLASFNPPGGLEYIVYPNSFRVVTSGVNNFMPNNVTVQFQFEAAPAGPDGLPDVGAASYVPLTSDISDLNAVAPDFIRFDVLFNLDALNAGLSATSPRPALDFSRIKFRF